MKTVSKKNNEIIYFPKKEIILLRYKFKSKINIILIYQLLLLSRLLKKIWVVIFQTISRLRGEKVKY